MKYTRSVFHRLRYAVFAIAFFCLTAFFAWKFVNSTRDTGDGLLFILLILAFFDALLVFNFAKWMIWSIDISGNSVTLFPLIGPGKRLNSIQNLIAMNMPYRDLVLWRVLIIKHSGGEEQIPGVDEFGDSFLQRLETAIGLKIIKITGETDR